ncbi:MAG: hypothetical protein JNJ41_11615 [Bacteroidia bacterium]|nr:hypothetical protein [Bacteroidia bacterium]
MKANFTATAMLILFVSVSAFGKKTELFESKYFIFQNSKQLNAHLYLYNRALGCKFTKKPNDSLAYYSFRDKYAGLNANEVLELNSIMLYYRDSLTSKDLLFDNTMSDFSDYLSDEGRSKFKLKVKWQAEAFEVLKKFQPYFTKLYWPVIDSTNKAWLNTYKDQIIKMETTIIPELERIYQTKLPAEKVRVDLTCYATWAGAYSFKNAFEHIIYSTANKANQGDLAAEVVFHEASHFLVDKLSDQIFLFAKDKEVKKLVNVWHNVLFYTTGYVVEKHYKSQWKKFEPYYVQMKFEEKFPDFKVTVAGCKLYWNDYMEGKIAFDEALKKIVDFQLEKG